MTSTTYTFDKQCPALCERKTDTNLVHAQALDPSRHRVTDPITNIMAPCSTTQTDCAAFVKGTKWPLNVLNGPLARPDVITSDGTLLHSYTQWCGQCDNASAICARTDYNDDPETLKNCCLNVPSSYKADQQDTTCPTGYCSDTNSASPGCSNFILDQIKTNIDFAGTYYDTFKHDFPTNQVQNTMLALCSADNGKNLPSLACSQFCSDTDYNTGKFSICNNIITNYCKDKRYIGKNNDPVADICGCYYPDETLYSNYYDALAKELGCKDPNHCGLVNEKQCFFRPCAGAKYQPKINQPCQNLSVLNCVENVNVNNDGSIGNITIKQGEDCKLSNDIPPGGGGNNPPNNNPPNNNPDNGNNPPDNGNNPPDNNNDNQPSFWEKYKLYIILGIVLFVVILIGLIILIAS